MENVGEIASAITALFALISIIVSISENKKMREQTESLEKRRYQSARFEELCLVLSGTLNESSIFTLNEAA